MSIRAIRQLLPGFVSSLRFDSGLLWVLVIQADTKNIQVIYNEGWGQLPGPPYPEQKLREIVLGIDPTRLIDSVTGWNDHGFSDFSVS